MTALNGSRAVVGGPDSPPRLVNVHKHEGDGDGDDHRQFTSPAKTEGGGEACADDIPTPMTLPMTSPMSSGNTISSTSSNSRASNSNTNTNTNNGNNRVLTLDRSLSIQDYAAPLSDKLMNITITVESLHGFVAKKKSSGSHLNMPTNKLQKRKANGLHTNPTATIVASFSQNISKDKVFLTHVPSLPVKLDPTKNTNTKLPSSGASVSTTSSGGTSSDNHLNPSVHWPSMVGVDEGDASGALSTLQFQRMFKREGARRFVPQTCPINLSISRNGKMALLGKVNLIINGEERGKNTVTVPIASSIRESIKSKNVNNLKKIRNIRKKDTAANKEETPMVKIKGDTFQFGLEGDSMLRVLVSVSDPAEIAAAKKREDKMSASDRAGEARPSTDENDGKENDSACDEYSLINEGNEDAAEDDSIKEKGSIKREEGDSIEGDSSLEQDDYYTMQHYMMENDEMRTLRQQLAKSEQTNNILQMELANAQYTVNNSIGVTDDDVEELIGENEVLREENESLRAELKRSKGNADTLMGALTSAQQETEMIPFYEQRVNELLEELKKRDVEVDCLKDEIGELRGHYKEQLVGGLLWDANEDTKKGAESLLWDENDISTPKPNDEDAVEENAPAEGIGWGVRKLGISLVEKIVVRDDTKNEQAVEEALPVVPEVTEAGNEVLPEDQKEYIGLVRPNTPGAPPEADEEDETATPHANPESVEEEEKKDTSVVQQEAAAAAASSDDSPRNDGADNDASSKKKGGGWGVRRLGARLNQMEEKMRIRQQQFREQQQLAEREKAAQLKAEQLKAEPGLGNVLISRISSHGGVRPMEVGTSVLEKVEEGGEEVKNVEESAVEQAVEEPAMRATAEEANGESTSNQSSVDTTEGDCKATTAVADDSLDNGNRPKGEDEEGEEKEEEPIHRGSTFNQELLLESMEDLEKALMAPPALENVNCSNTITAEVEDDPSHDGLVSCILSEDMSKLDLEGKPESCYEKNSEEEQADSVSSQASRVGLISRILSDGLDPDNSVSVILCKEETSSKANEDGEEKEESSNEREEITTSKETMDNGGEARPEEKTEEDIKGIDNEPSSSTLETDDETGSGVSVEVRVKEIEKKVLNQPEHLTKDINGALTADSSECKEQVLSKDSIEVNAREGEKPLSFTPPRKISEDSNETIEEKVKEIEEKAKLIEQKSKEIEEKAKEFEERAKELEEMMPIHRSNNTSGNINAPIADSSECKEQSLSRESIEVNVEESEKPVSTPSINPDDAKDSVVGEEVEKDESPLIVTSKDIEDAIAKADSAISSPSPTTRVSFKENDVETSSSSSGDEGFDDEFLQLISDSSSDALSNSQKSRRSQENLLKLPDSTVE